VLCVAVTGLLSVANVQHMFNKSELHSKAAHCGNALHKFHIGVDRTIYMHEMGFNMGFAIELLMFPWE
jgi:hypothetical protein